MDKDNKKELEAIKEEALRDKAVMASAMMMCRDALKTIDATAIVIAVTPKGLANIVTMGEQERVTSMLAASLAADKRLRHIIPAAIAAYMNIENPEDFVAVLKE